MRKFTVGDRVTDSLGLGEGTVKEVGDGYLVRFDCWEEDYFDETGAHYRCETDIVLVSDPVKNPSHYQFPGGVEVMDLIQHLNFPRGSAVKYICRAGRKSKETELQDLRKARENIDFEIARVEAADALESGGSDHG